MKSHRAYLLFAGAVATAVGCGGASGADLGPGGTSTDDGSSANGDAGPGKQCGTKDDPDDQGIDSNCDGADGIVGKDVYVATAGSDTNSGTPQEPLRTLSAAIKLAVATKGRVIALAGTYPVDTLSQDAWAIYGGYAAGFAGPPIREQTVLSPMQETGVLLEGQSAVLAHVAVAGSPPSTQAMAYALRTRVVQLLLDDAVVRTADALSAPAAQTGTLGGDGGNGKTQVCNGATQPTYVTGSYYSASAEGKPAGSYNAQNPGASVRAVRATDGAPAGDGINATADFGMLGDLLQGTVGEPGKSDGTPGYGAAAGGNGGGWRDGPDWQKQGVWGGPGGSGGCPGEGGQGAQSGGSSVAILVLAGKVTVQRSQLVTGLAGNGGDGGDGGPGGHGGWGGSPTGAGNYVGYPNFACKCPIDDPSLQSCNDPMNANCAAFGGEGGSGGTGGHGGGGAGGSSIGVATYGTTSVTLDPSSNVVLGPAGTGGSGSGGGRAPNGRRVATFQIQLLM